VPPIRALLRRYRVALLALLVSAAIHAAVISGVPGRAGAVDPSAAAVFSATLEAATAVEPDPTGSAPKPAPPRPKRAAPKPRPKPSPPKPEEMIAQAPALETPPPPPAPEPEPAPAPEPDLPPAPLPEFKPEMLALAEPAVAIKSLEPEQFPTNALPSRLKITYALNSVFADGKASYEWERDGDEYVITGDAAAEGFFTLFLEGRVTQSSRGKVTAEGLRPESFSEQKPGSPPEGLEFDWANRKVTFDRKGEKITEELFDNTVDWLTMIFQLAHRPPKGDSFDLRVFTQRRLYTFKLKVLGEDELDLPIGKVRALHLRHADEAKNEYVDVWLGVDQHYMPVKLRYPVARNRFMVEQTAIRISED
jgi:hypothetical protein